VVTPGANTRERIRTHNGSKRVKSGKDVPFGVSSKNGHPHPHQPPNSVNFALQKPFSLRTRINLGGSPTKIRIRIGNSPWGFQMWG